MDPQVVEALLKFADDLRTARAAWAVTKGFVQQRRTADSEDGA
jgi:hypothetical protein